MKLILIFLSTFLSVATALDPAKIKISVSGNENVEWNLLNAPTSCSANTPRFEFGVASENVIEEKLTFEAEGSLGLKDHPLGIFKFHDSGDAEEGSKVMYILDGVLGQIKLTFSHTESSVFKMNARVDVWTVIPSLPPLISTGFQVNIRLKTVNGDTVMNLVVSISQPATSGAEKSQDVCQTDVTNFPAYPPTSNDLEIPRVTVNLDDPASTRWGEVVKSRAKNIRNLIDTFMKSSEANRTVIRMILSYVAEKEMAYVKSHITRTSLITEK